MINRITPQQLLDGEGDGKKHILDTKGEYRNSTRKKIKEECMMRLARSRENGLDFHESIPATISATFTIVDAV
jgi:hypothetical protein